jgi:tetratricopeptide (TPR) repeat protein
LLVLALVAAVLAGFRVWRGRAAARQEQIALTRVADLLKDGKARDALTLVEVFIRQSPNEHWRRVELEALTAAADLPRLAMIFDRESDRVLADERASVLMARAFLHARRPEDFGRVRDSWRGREVQHDAWLALDSDALLVAGKVREAHTLLQSKPLSGAMDATRLTRLALLTAKGDLAEAWRMLAQAASLRPRDPDIRSFRAQVLESLGKIELARVEYVAALVAQPQDPFLRDQLAEFYVRSQNPDLALDTWSEGLSRSTPDFLRLKAHFWSRVLRPSKLPPLDPLPPGGLDPVARQIAALPLGRFFDEPQFLALPEARLIGTQRQEVFWLRLLEDLRNGRDVEAMERLQFDPSRLRSWDPDLAAALMRILHYRKTHSLHAPGLSFASTRPEASRPTFFVALEKAARDEQSPRGRVASFPPDIAALLRGPHAFSAAFLAAGWREAALQLRPNPGWDPGEPEWCSVGLAQALRINRGPSTALAFLQNPSLPPAASLLRAELLAELGRRDQARTELDRLCRLDSGVGFRASLLLALDAAELKEFEKARQFITRQPLLARDQVGQEILARIALIEGNQATAEQIYRGIVKTSVEAKTWYARQAFSQSRWEEARQLTRELLAMLPDSIQLRENLLAIDQAQARP